MGTTAGVLVTVTRAAAGTAVGVPVTAAGATTGAGILDTTVSGVAGLLVGGVSITASVLIVLAAGTNGLSGIFCTGGLSVVTGIVPGPASVLLAAGTPVLSGLELGSSMGGLTASSVFSVCARRAVDSASGPVALFI